MNLYFWLAAAALVLTGTRGPISRRARTRRLRAAFQRDAECLTRSEDSEAMELFRENLAEAMYQVSEEYGFEEVDAYLDQIDENGKMFDYKTSDNENMIVYSGSEEEVNRQFRKDFEAGLLPS